MATDEHQRPGEIGGTTTRNTGDSMRKSDTKRTIESFVMPTRIPWDDAWLPPLPPKPRFWDFGRVTSLLAATVVTTSGLIPPIEWWYFAVGVFAWTGFGVTVYLYRAEVRYYRRMKHIRETYGKPETWVDEPA